jgi:hypothetical protein
MQSSIQVLRQYNMMIANEKSLHIPIIIKEEDGIARKNEPIRIGIPLPRGLVANEKQLALSNPAGTTLPLQKKVLENWPDGSFKWVLLNFLVEIPSKSTSIFHVKKLVTTAKDNFDQFQVDQTQEKITITTGSTIFSINRKREDMGYKIISSSDHSPITIALTLTDCDDQDLAFVVQDCFVESQGPVHCSVKKTGRFTNQKNKYFCNVTLIHHFYTGCTFSTVDVIIHNPRAAYHYGGLWDLGDPASFLFKDLSLSATLPAPPENISWQIDTGEPLQSANSSNWKLYQDSSGGNQWNSPNHVDHQNNPTVSFPGFRLNIDQLEQHKIYEGQRATPFLQTSGDSLFFSGAIFEFWQNFPKAIRLKENIFSMSLFPRESKTAFELQGGEQKRHTVFFQAGKTNDYNAIPQLLAPLTVYVDPEWISKAETISYFTSAGNQQAQYQQYIDNIIEGKNSFFRKREKIDEFGWRNFGDIYADHEAVNHTGKTPFISHYNNQYDFIYGALIHFMRTGDKRWRNLAVPSARHVIDIDIYHTCLDKDAYNHGLFWHSDHYLQACTATHRAYSKKNKTNSGYGGGTSNEHIYSSGLALYYFMTGDILAKETVLELAEYVLHMDDGGGIFSLFDEGPTGLASQTVETSYHKPGRGPGNCINCLIDAYRLSSKRAYIDKAEELIRRCIHPQDDILSLHLDEPECRWSYLVFLQVVGKYLDYKSELGETGYSFFYARDSLLHYADWMAEHESPYQEVLHKVLIPTETWPAHDIRKCHIFHLAAKYSPEKKRHEYAQKATYFYDRCLNDLLSYKTAYLTRPLVILCVYGYVHDYFLKNGYGMESISRCYDFGSPQTFLPQRLRFKKHFLEKLKNTLRIVNQMIREKISLKINRH